MLRSLPQKLFIKTIYRIQNAGRALEKVSKLGVEIIIYPAISKRVSNLILGGCRTPGAFGPGGVYNTQIFRYIMSNSFLYKL